MLKPNGPHLAGGENIYNNVRFATSEKMPASHSTGGAPMHSKAAHCTLLSPSDRRVRIALRIGQKQEKADQCHMSVENTLKFIRFRHE